MELLKELFGFNSIIKEEKECDQNILLTGSSPHIGKVDAVSMQDVEGPNSQGLPCCLIGKVGAVGMQDVDGPNSQGLPCCHISKVCSAGIQDGDVISNLSVPNNRKHQRVECAFCVEFVARLCIRVIMDAKDDNGLTEAKIRTSVATLLCHDKRLIAAMIHKALEVGETMKIIRMHPGGLYKRGKPRIWIEDPNPIPSKHFKALCSHEEFGQACCCTDLMIRLCRRSILDDPEADGLSVAQIRAYIANILCKSPRQLFKPVNIALTVGVDQKLLSLSGGYFKVGIQPME